MNSTYQYIRKLLYSIGIVIISLTMLVSCDSCNPYVKKSAVIALFTAESTNVTQGKEATVKYNVKNLVSGRFEADYNHDGTISESEKDTVSNYDGEDATFTTRKLENLGDLEIKLIVTGEDGNEVSAKTSVKVIAHALPDISASDFTVVEGKTVTFELPTVSGVEYTTIKTLNDSSKVLSSSVDASSNKMTIQVSDDVTEQGSYDVQLGYSIPETGITGTLSKTGNVIKNLCRVQARLELSSDPGTLQPGEARIYNEETMASEGDWLAQQNSSDGLVDLKANAPASKISLQGFVSGKNSFWAKLSLDGTKDYLIKNGVLTFDSSGNVTKYGQAIVRANYYASSINAAKQRAIWEKVNSLIYLASDGKPYGMIFPDLKNLKVIEVIQKDPYSNSELTAAAKSAIEELYKSDPRIKRAFGGRDLSGLVQMDGLDEYGNNIPPSGCDKQYSLVGDSVVANKNCYIITLSTKTNPDGIPTYNGLSGIANGLVIEISHSLIASSNLSPLIAVLIHETGHGLAYFLAHTPQMYESDSVMVPQPQSKLEYGEIDYSNFHAAENDSFPLRSPSYKTHGLKAGPYD